MEVDPLHNDRPDGRIADAINLPAAQAAALGPRSS
jgi:hypothetical protein